MPYDPTKWAGLSGEQCIRAAFDETSGTLRVASTSSASMINDMEVSISHDADSIKIGDGTDFLTVNTNGSINVVGPVTDAQLRATPLPVQATLDTTGLATDTGQTAGNNSLASINTKTPTLVSGRTPVDGSGVTQPVSGTVAVSNFPANQLVSGSISINNLPAVQPVSDNNGSLTVDGTISVSNFPGTQVVSGSISINNLPAVQPVSDNGGSITVDGTFWQATQPISAASLPLPSGASQEHTAANSPHSVRLTDGTSFYKATTPSDTQSVSGTVAATQSGSWVLAANNGIDIGDTTINNAAGASAVNIQDGGNSITIDGSITANAGTNLNTSALALDATLTGRSAKAQITDGTRDGTVKAASTAAIAADTSVVVALSPNSPIPTGTNVIGALSANQSTNVAQFAGTNVSTGTGASGAGIPRVTVANDSNVLATQSGTWTVQPGNTPNTTPWLVKSNVDTGRTNIQFYAVGVAAGTTGTETAISLTKASGTSATSAAASWVITNAKTFRITSISVATRGHATATIQSTTFNLRINTAGAVTTSSTPVVLAARSATPATSSAWDRLIIPVGDGIEFVGNGTIQFGITAAATYVTNAPTWDVLITGFEY